MNLKFFITSRVPIQKKKILRGYEIIREIKMSNGEKDEVIYFKIHSPH